MSSVSEKLVPPVKVDRVREEEFLGGRPVHFAENGIPALGHIHDDDVLGR